MDSAANSDARGMLAVPETDVRSIDVRQHRATCVIGILGGIVSVSVGRIWLNIATALQKLLQI